MSDQNWWEYEQLESQRHWGDNAVQGEEPWDDLDFHLDLGCGKLPKGRLGIDRFYAPGVGLMIDLANMLPSRIALDATTSEGAVAERTDQLYRGVGFAFAGLPFPDDSIESIISHHFFEHLYGEQMIRLMDECYRVLKPGGVLRVITPLFPSSAAVDDPDHKMMITERTFHPFCGTADGDSWLESFSVPYTSARFEMVDISTSLPTPPELRWTDQDAREIRVALRKWGA